MGGNGPSAVLAMSPDPVNTPPGVAAVLRELDAIHATIRETKADVRRDLTEHRQEIKAEGDAFRTEVNEKLDEAVKEAKATNGRLRKVELVVGVLKSLAVIAVAATPFVIFYMDKVT